MIVSIPINPVSCIYDFIGTKRATTMRGSRYLKQEFLFCECGSYGGGGLLGGCIIVFLLGGISMIVWVSLLSLELYIISIWFLSHHESRHHERFDFLKIGIPVLWMWKLWWWWIAWWVVVVLIVGGVSMIIWVVGILEVLITNLVCSYVILL